MTLLQFYTRSVDIGMAVDLRGPEALQRDLTAISRAYETLPTAGRIGFDNERLWNPFGDTRPVHGDMGTPLKGFVTGIDIDESAFRLVRQLRAEGKRVDAIVSHHTSGWGLHNIEDVLSAQFHRVVDAGVPEDKARELMDLFARSKRESWTREHKLRLAEAYDIPVLLAHTPADNCHVAHTKALMDEWRPSTVADAVALLNEAPELGKLEGRGDGVRIVVGEPHAAIGRAYYAMGTGWNPTPQVLFALAEAGVNTALMVTPGESLSQAARECGVSIIGMPHEGQDSLGMSLLYAQVIGDEEVAIYPCGGYLMRRERFRSAAAA